MKTLVIGPSWIGDMVMAQSLYRVLKHKDKNINIDVLAPSWNRDLLKRMPEVANSIDMPIGHGELAIAQRYNIAKLLKSKQYDNAIVLPNSFKSALIPFFAGIPKRTGWLGEMRYGLLNDIRYLNKKFFARMVERYVSLAFDASDVGCADGLSGTLLYPRLSIDSSEVDLAIDVFGLSKKADLIALCPGAAFGLIKCWPHYHYGKLANLLVEKGKHIVIIGSMKDQWIASKIANLLPNFDCYTDLTGETTLEQAINLLAACQAVISNDSGLMHIAAALDRPVLALYGPTSPRFAPPLSNRSEIICLNTRYVKMSRAQRNSGYHQSLNDITPKLVFQKLMHLLSREVN